MKSLLFFLCAFALGRIAASASGDKLVDYANILQGTDSNRQFSHGNTLPLVGMPWGMVAWSMQNGTGGWFFSPNGRVDGIRATHEPSPWMGDYARFVLMPQSGELRMDAKARTQVYDANTAILHPDYEKLDLKQDAITLELTGTERCGVFRFTYRAGTTGRLILDGADKSKVDLKIEGRTIYGRAPDKHFPSYFIVKLDRDIIKAPPSANSKDVPGYVEFPTTPTEPVIVKVGTSFISWKQAEQNLRAETEGHIRGDS